MNAAFHTRGNDAAVFLLAPQSWGGGLEKEGINGVCKDRVYLLLVTVPLIWLHAYHQIALSSPHMLATNSQVNARMV